MGIVYFLFILPLLWYCQKLIHWRRTWLWSAVFTSGSGKQGVPLSLIIPFKDEAANLASLIHSLNKQSWDCWELILVNDHSIDNSLEVLRSALTSFKYPVRVIEATASGKKAALLQGVQAARYQYIVTSDADCTFHADWLASIAAYFALNKADLIIGPVSLTISAGWLQRFQQLDFAALQLSGGAAALDGKPIMCNGANLACRKELYLRAQIQPVIASGDDMFLLEWMKKEGCSIHYLKTPRALVQTHALDSFASFMQQRARWAAKARNYRDRHIIGTGILVSVTNFILFLSLVLVLWQPYFLIFFCTSLFLKSLFDYRLLKLGESDLGLKLSFMEVLVWQLLYPLYVLITLLYPLFVTVRWKSRHI
ncbi:MULTISPECIES: glycosyltransferase [unclassified Carboxylicivirga]|uniref:glycosyltransferase n=1 Tax=Carboxylicivirga TaxID=1628153 RepID=UPI003D356D02